MLFIFSAAGLWLLLTGMGLMKDGLEKSAQKKLQATLQNLAGTPFKSAVAGLVTTLLVQSSTAVTVISVGLVNAGIMNLAQAVGIILGANVGTCATVQIISFDLGHTALLAGFAGAVLWICGKTPFLKNTGRALAGFGLIFTGLRIISLSLAPLQHDRRFLEFLYALSDSPVQAVFAGAVASGVLHSSAAATGIVMLLSGQGLLPLSGAIAIILGNNIGTCFTAVVASLGGSAAGKRVAVAHVVLNVAGVVVFLPLLPLFTFLVGLTADNLARQVANAHTIFNVISSLLAFPFTGTFARTLERIIPQDGKQRRK